ncbi:MAG: low molecular weight protein arginine phosphatase [Nitrospinaceae bacterium]|mgnify:CR=1 FL=1|jgi:protein arginine phosphatase|nr:low molecular weight protein arginine phosphatase [Nitrospinaceae bacterium]MBT3823066.1 low molecular weight protein arginine phosphatase [Nitrospinaceae bacterium]MBT4095849.1 low molecular weight protein arginine phosphatase [Nitrospinaceae bacterium]MBT4430896.1 low molecular weight protein arginine phosphatase [Nitrospinaceae bacterium]MBT5367727.1 low molecular weight protein arginine phosphatase [Nitrospinaceae bacterium]
MNILFLCTGNLCRSPMAEALLKKFASRDGLRELHAKSAGTHAFAGSKSPAEAQEVASLVGLDLVTHVAQPLASELVEWADQIAVMSPEHADFIEMNYPEGIDKVVELVKYRPGGKPGDTIKDPYGMKLFHYRQYFGELMEALQGYYVQLKDAHSKFR